MENKSLAPQNLKKYNDFNCLSRSYLENTSLKVHGQGTPIFFLEYSIGYKTTPRELELPVVVRDL